MNQKKGMSQNTKDTSHLIKESEKGQAVKERKTNPGGYYEIEKEARENKI